MKKLLGPARPLSAAAVALILLGISSCAQAPGAQKTEVLSSEDIKGISQRERDAGNSETAELMSDGVVDKANYDQAFSNLERCMNEGGYDVTAPVINPGDGISYVFKYSLQGRDPEAMNKDSLKCEQRYWAAISAAYTNTNEQTMEEPVRAAAQKCLKDAGFSVPDSARNAKSMAGDPLADEGAQRKAATTCILETIYKVHPEIESVGLSW